METKLEPFGQDKKHPRMNMDSTCIFHPVSPPPSSSPHVAQVPVGEGQVVFLAWTLPARGFQDRSHGCKYRYLLCPWQCPPTDPPYNNMAAHQRCACLEALKEGEIAVVVCHMPL